MNPPAPNPRTPDDDSLIQGGNWLSARLENLIASHTPTCEEAVRMLSDSQDRPLTFNQYLSLRAHFLICCYCRRYNDHLHHLRHCIHSLEDHLEEFVPEHLDEDAKRQIKEHLLREE